MNNLVAATTGDVDFVTTTNAVNDPVATTSTSVDPVDTTNAVNTLVTMTATSNDVTTVPTFDNVESTQIRSSTPSTTSLEEERETSSNEYISASTKEVYELTRGYNNNTTGTAILGKRENSEYVTVNVLCGGFHGLCN